jgi:hypothetical protein
MKQTDNPINKTWRKLQTRSGVLVLLTAAILMEVGSAVQYYFARNGIRDEVRQRAASEMQVKNLEIQQVVSRVETAVGNLHWALEQSIAHPDSVYPIMRRIMEKNPDLTGCAIAFLPDYYPSKGYWYEPYVFRDKDILENKQIGSAEHNYLEMPWFIDGLGDNDGLWTEPYIDSAGSEGMVCTYTIPLRDNSGRTVAVFAADVSLDWLGDLFEQKAEIQTYLFSHAGRVMVCPDSTLVMRITLEETARLHQDTMAAHLNEAVQGGKQGSTNVKYNGEKYYIHYSPVGGNTGWSMALFFPDKEIYKGLHRVSQLLLISMFLGLMLLAFIMWRTFRGIQKLGEVSAEKERIGSELKIARDIQQGMLPKTFPPYPDCEEVTIYGSLVPAKEVGGDLYDFQILDGHLLFCVGDVSGKGVPASLMMAVTRSLFRTVCARTTHPEEIMNQMNTAMSEMNENSIFVTFFIGNLDLKTGILTYSNAAHCPPVLVNETISTLQMDSNIPLGVMEWDYTRQEIHVGLDSVIFLYTDGLTEAENTTHGQFGEARMLAELEKMADATPRNLIDHISEVIQVFESGTEQSDDLTMLAIRYTHASK